MRLINIDKEREQWLSKGYEVYSYDRKKMIEETRKDPVWIHFGSGNLFRAYQADFCDRLLNQGVINKGVIVVSGRSSSGIDTYYRDMNDLYISVVLKSDGNIDKKVIGSIAESIKIEEEERLKEIFSNPSLQVVSFTITEKGYKVSQEERDAYPDTEKSYFGKITKLLYERYLNGAYPLTMSSHDNCSHNGDVLKKAIMAFADRIDDARFNDYLKDKVSFPIAMIDKITPRPDKRIAEILRKDGVEEVDELDPAYYMNCFVNSEESEYLVIEDDFTNGRPSWEKAGVIFTDRETVDKVEKMKVGTCLNPVHTSLAVFGCLLDHHLICEEMKDDVLNKLARHVGYDEGLPVVTDPGIIDPKEFIDTVIDVRLPNPFMPDAPQRIAMDTSQKLPVRFGETLKAYLKKGEDLSELTYIPLVFAGWLRYLTGINDKGEEFELPSDPMLEELKPLVTYTLGDEVKKEDILSILKNDKIFGVDLYENGLSDKVISYLNEMLKEKGAVRRTLEKYV
ncbi:MAG: mannitol dehydrogenase family protein [Erysipelotrichaceae bacterium]|nr:mannitol dehydrogenase family protein [Erysipelotrichaceae bacterium]